MDVACPGNPPFGRNRPPLVAEAGGGECWSGADATLGPGVTACKDMRGRGASEGMPSSWALVSFDCNSRWVHRGDQIGNRPRAKGQAVHHGGRPLPSLLLGHRRVNAPEVVGAERAAPGLPGVCRRLLVLVRHAPRPPPPLPP